MNILSTLYYPELNPVGAPSILAAVVVLIFVVLSSNWVFRLPGTTRHGVVFLAPWVFLLLLMFTEGSPFVRARSFPDADDRVAELTYAVFGFAFALELLRLPRLLYRLNGMLSSLFLGSVLVFDVARMQISFFGDRWITIALVPAFWVAWLPIVFWINLRVVRRLNRAKGLCVKCGYNLTGNESGTCPECGLAVHQNGKVA